MKENLPGLDIGRDRVLFDGDIVIIYAWRQIPDWKVREYRRKAIYFQDRKYYLRRRDPAERPFDYRYELAPWPADLHEQSRQTFAYDEAFVAERDRDALSDQQRELIWHLLLPFYPLLGFCWAGYKERVLEPLGFIPRSITAASTFLTFVLAICDAILFGFLGGGIISQLHGRRLFHGWTDLWDLLLLAIFVGDCLVRYSELLSVDGGIPLGFLEWVAPHGKRKGHRS